MHNPKEKPMKTVQEMETEAILSMVENMKALEQQLADAKNRIDSLEKVIANQRAMINELQ
jgi:nicotinic acid mononucleotide adenylyltransferase